MGDNCTALVDNSTDPSPLWSAVMKGFVQCQSVCRSLWVTQEFLIKIDLRSLNAHLGELSSTSAVDG